MASFRNGDHEAAGRLVELFYPELRRIAAARMRAERPDHTLQPTALVHQLYLELVRVKALRPATSGGARAEKLELSDLPSSQSGTERSLLEIDDVLNRLAAINPVLRPVVELRVLEGLAREEIAREMGCGTATVSRHSNFARNWLEEAFAGTPGL
jgi:DNA-directed RNA polymerase specialized sigma24 family protein